EWPGAALTRAGLVDGAFAGLAIEKDAVAIGELLQAFAGPNVADVAVFELRDLNTNQSSQSRDFLVVDPNVARRARTAVAALSAIETQTGVVPGKIGHVSRVR